MNWIDFGIRMFAALFLGGVIGLERQWRQRMTGLRTNGLVAVGSAMFVMMGGLIAGDGSQGRVTAHVVSGKGFLGGGVILKDGFHIRGMNTGRYALVHGGYWDSGRAGAPWTRCHGSRGRTFSQPNPSPRGVSDQSHTGSEGRTRNPLPAPLYVPDFG